MNWVTVKKYFLTLRFGKPRVYSGPLRMFSLLQSGNLLRLLQAVTFPEMLPSCGTWELQREKSGEGSRGLTEGGAAPTKSIPIPP